MTRLTALMHRPWPMVVIVWALAVAHAVLLLAAQYLRVAPLGAAYVLDVKHYIGYAVLYELFGLGLLSLPFLLLALRAQSRRSVVFLNAVHACVLACSLLLSQLNHELQRFMGAQLTLDYITTYARIDRTPEVVWQTLREDQGGAYSALLLYLAAVSFLWLALRASQLRLPQGRPALLSLGIVFFAMAYAVPTGWLLSRGGGNRKLKLRPPVVLLYASATEAAPDERRFVGIDRALATVQRDWLAADGSGRCRFDSPQQPLRRSCEAGPALEKDVLPNIVVLALETFRARDMGAFNPGLKVSPTPFLDALSQDEHSARYVRYISNGIPTVYAFMSLHTGTLPHSERTVASAFTNVQLDAFPRLLRERGYRTMFFTGSDPDWDNQRYWLNHWYDETYYDPAHHERDRLVFADAAARLLRAGRSGKPFLATIASISNHTPFRSPEPALNLNAGATVVDRLHNTMHYTDDVVRGFFEALRGEPWFDRTVFIVTGDHAFDLGERGAPQGHTNLHHESVWVPLIVHGKDARLARGVQTRVASHMDLAPTIAELAGHGGPYAFLGHSLLSPITPHGFSVAMRNRSFGIEAHGFSAYLPPEGAHHVYLDSDALQEHPVAADSLSGFTDVVTGARALSLATDWAFEHDAFAPAPSAPGRGPAGKPKIAQSLRDHQIDPI